MSIEPKELTRDELENIRAEARIDLLCQNGMSDAEKHRIALLGHIAAMAQEEEHLHRLTHRQGKLLSGVVNAIRGEPGPLTLWSHHDAPELAQRAMAVVMAAATVDGAIKKFDISRDFGNAAQQLSDALDVFVRNVERHVPLSTLGVELPGWQETFQKVEAGFALNPIETLICRLTPGDDERAKDFRRMLRAALDYTAEQAKAVNR